MPQTPPACRAIRGQGPAYSNAGCLLPTAPCTFSHLRRQYPEPTEDTGAKYYQHDNVLGSSSIRSFE